MTDNEIVKALECCTTNVASCKDCPAFVKVDRSNCKKYFRGALDLINRLQVENKRLSTLAELGNMRANDYRVMRDRALKAEAEIERLRDNNNLLTEAGQEWQKRYETAKAEAYKEFAEKAKEIINLIVDLMFDDSVIRCQVPNCHKTSSISCGSEICIQENKAYWHGKLDNLLKEMEGGASEVEN